MTRIACRCQGGGQIAASRFEATCGRFVGGVVLFVVFLFVLVLFVFIRISGRHRVAHNHERTRMCRVMLLLLGCGELSFGPPDARAVIPGGWKAAPVRPLRWGRFFCQNGGREEAAALPDA